MGFWHTGSGLLQRLCTGAGTWALALAVLPGWSASPVRFAPEKDYGPFVFEAPDGRVQGLSIDMLEALKPLMMDSVLTLPAQPLHQILEAARLGQVDLISSLRATPERAAFLAFTAPYVEVPAVLVVRQGLSLPHLRDMQGQRVAVGQGYAVESFVRQNFRQVDWQAVPDDLAGLQGLLQGRYQGVVADIASVSHAIRVHQIKGVQVAQAIGFEYPLSFAYRKELPELGQELDAALLQLGLAQRQAIVDRWVDAQALRFEDPQRTLLRWVGLGLALVGVGLWTWAALRRRGGGGL